MFHIIFLIFLALIWIIFAVIQDLRKREIANWLNFSLIIFALGFRFFYSLFSNSGFEFFYQGLIGLGIFFVLGNLLYYGRMFAGGDAKLLFALGAILPFSYNFNTNLNLFVLFLILFFFSGAIYGIFVSGFLISRNFKKFKKELSKQVRINKFSLVLSFLLFLVIMVLSFLVFSNLLIFYFGIFILVIPLLYLSAKSIDEVCMVKKISPKFLREGDWLYRDVKVGNKVLKKKWEGLSLKDIKLLRKKKFVLIRHGIAFGPVFLISFLTFIYFYFSGIGQELLRNSLW